MKTGVEVITPMPAVTVNHLTKKVTNLYSKVENLMVTETEQMNVNLTVM